MYAAGSVFDIRNDFNPHQSLVYLLYQCTLFSLIASPRYQLDGGSTYNLRLTSRVGGAIVGCEEHC